MSLTKVLVEQWAKDMFQRGMSLAEVSEVFRDTIRKAQPINETAGFMAHSVIMVWVLKAVPGLAEPLDQDVELALNALLEPVVTPPKL